MNVDMKMYVDIHMYVNKIQIHCYKLKFITCI